jgi:hypothetical protein
MGHVTPQLNVSNFDFWENVCCLTALIERVCPAIARKKKNTLLLVRIVHMI